MNNEIDDNEEKTTPRVEPAAQEPVVKPWGTFTWGEDVRTVEAPAEESST